MAITYDVVMRIYNGTDWDTLRPQTVSDNVEDTGQTHQFVTAQQKTNLDSLFDGSNVFKGLWANNPVVTGWLTVDDGATSEINLGYTRIVVGGIGITGDNNAGGIGTYVGAWSTFIGIVAGQNYMPIKDGVTFRYGTTSISDAKDLVTKEYVDTVAVNIRPATAVVAASTANITNPTTTYMSTLDGYTLADGNRVLLKDQSVATENGLYTFSIATHYLTKVTPAGNDNVNGTLVFVTYGTVNRNDRWYCISYSSGSWILFDSNIELIAGSGISVSGNTVSVATSGVTNAMLAGSIENAKLLLTPTGALEYGTGNNIQVKASGITNTMLAGSISVTKLDTFSSTADTDAWASIAAAASAQTLEVKLTDIFSAIKLLRGTAAYNTSNTQSIASAFTDMGTILGSGVTATLKNKITRGTTLPVSNMAIGDICFLHA